MRRKDVQPFVFWIGILLLVVLLGTLAGGEVTLRGESAATPTLAPLPTATVAGSPSGPLLSDSRGFISLPGAGATAELRRETDPAPISTLRGQGFIGAVSGTGRRVAYWASRTADAAARELRALDVTAPDRASATAVDLATGRTAPLPMSGSRLAAPISFR